MASQKWAPRNHSGLALKLAAACLFIFYVWPQIVGGLWETRQSFSINITKATTTKALPILTTRNDLPQLLEEEDLKIGIEIGVQRGHFAEEILKTWKSCKRYYLVDVWKEQENYFEGANVPNEEQDALFAETQTRLQPWAGKTTFLRMFSAEAAGKIPDNAVDFVYVDARHDYCGVAEDLELYWPKMKQGGIFAGHDYMTAEDVAHYMPHEDWGVCADGSRNNGSVKAAVNEFAARQNLQIVVTYREAYPTWMIRKPVST